MSDKIIVTLRSAPSVSIEILDEKCKRSCFGALRFYPGIPKAITKDELEHVKKAQGNVASKLDIRPYVESKRVDKRGASETEIEHLAQAEGIDHLNFKKKVGLLQERGKVQKPAFVTTAKRIPAESPPVPKDSGVKKRNGGKK